MNTPLAVVDLLADLVLLGALTGLHIAPTGLSPIADPVSRYGLTRFRAGYAVAAFSAAVAGGATALLLLPLPGSTIAVALLGVFAVARVLIPFFPMDMPETPRTRTGRIHNLLAVVAFSTATAAAFVAAGPLAQSGRPLLATLSTTAGIIMAVGSILVIAGLPSSALRRVTGAAERLIYLGFIAWFALIAIGFLS